MNAPAYRIPELNATVPVPLFDTPVRIEMNPPRMITVRLPDGQIMNALEVTPPGETDEEFKKRETFFAKVSHIKLRVTLVDPGERDKYERDLKRIAYEEDVRLRELKKKHDSKEWPELHFGAFQTEDGRDALDKAKLAWSLRTIAGIDGINMGEGATMVLSQTITDVPTLVAILRRLGWFDRAVRVSLGAQYLNGVQLLS